METAQTQHVDSVRDGRALVGESKQADSRSYKVVERVQAAWRDFGSNPNMDNELASSPTDMISVEGETMQRRDDMQRSFTIMHRAAFIRLPVQLL